MDQLDAVPLPAVKWPAAGGTVELLAREQMTLVMGKWPDAVPLKAGAAVRGIGRRGGDGNDGGNINKIRRQSQVGLHDERQSRGMELSPGLPGQLAKRENGSGVGGDFVALANVEHGAVGGEGVARHRGGGGECAGSISGLPEGKSSRHFVKEGPGH